ncbi:hypothetical protein A8B78_20275 [Jannaschia sp. EhC01]|nr:hypothetical protein A8B78_20275 [Jannaschia sp. EhC01]
MKYIVYVSQAVTPFSTTDLGDLLTHSRQRNSEDAISGLLVYRYNADYGRGNFLQVLEGPDDKLDDVWNRISSDSRHHTIIVIEEGEIEARMFADWSMGFKNVEDQDLAGVKGFTDLGSDDFWKNAEVEGLSEALDLLRGFYDAD